MTASYVDLHAHVLPALDDGAESFPTSLAMLRQLAAIGFSEVSATPHQKASQFLPTLSLVQQTFRETERAAAEAKIPIKLHLAAENYWDHVFFERQRAGTIPRYGNGPAFLFEIPTEELPVRFEDTLFQIAANGLRPVMAHPERYAPFVADVDRLVRIGRTAALVVDLGALAGYHGGRAHKLGRRLVSDGIAHAVASDVHSPSDVRAAAEGIAWIKKRLGEPVVKRLLADNPRAILSGVLPD